MNSLTDEEIESYILPANDSTGVKAITRESLEKIDLDEIEEVIVDGAIIKSLDGKQKFKRDDFTPRAGSYAFKPSFAGSQIIMGRTGRKLHFSNGRWFV